MVPTVESDAAQKDRRKGKKLQLKEAKLCLAHEAGSKTLSYGSTLQGDVSDAGKQLFGCALSAGFGKGSRVHALGDGADWIALQVEERFGSQGSYLVDYYRASCKTIFDNKCSKKQQFSLVGLRNMHFFNCRKTGGKSQMLPIAPNRLLECFQPF